MQNERRNFVFSFCILRFAFCIHRPPRPMSITRLLHRFWSKAKGGNKTANFFQSERGMQRFGEHFLSGGLFVTSVGLHEVRELLG